MVKRQTRRERAWAVIESMSSSWTNVNELARRAKIDAHAMSQFLQEAKAQGIVEYSRYPRREYGFRSWWRHI